MPHHDPTKKVTTSKAKTATRAIACVDLFCGAGGLTHGLSFSGLDVVAGIDLDDACRHPYEKNNKATFHKRDVADVTPAEIKRLFGDAPIRVLAGCAPCQPFSSYAQRYETIGTERWGLLSHFARLVKGVLPDIVTMENVPDVKKHQVFRDFVAALEGLDYKVWCEVVDAANYGLPQRRRRTVLLASRHGEIKLRVPDGSKKRTVRDALKGLPPCDRVAWTRTTACTRRRACHRST